LPFPLSYPQHFESFYLHNRHTGSALRKWRMGGDSNPRYLSVHTLSRRAQSTALSPIQGSRGYWFQSDSAARGSCQLRDAECGTALERRWMFAFSSPPQRLGRRSFHSITRIPHSFHSAIRVPQSGFPCFRRSSPSIRPSGRQLITSARSSHPLRAMAAPNHRCCRPDV
jgi:hypothetical protein